jgi:outer membrane protein assembly factor BamB
VAGAQENDLGWPQFRGPARNRVAPSQKWSWKWPKEGPKKLWTANVGEGFSCLIVSKGRVFGFGNFPKRKGAELQGNYVTCLDAETGALLWRTKVGEGRQPETGGTPCTDGNLLFSVTPDGDVSALEAATGKEVWKVNILRENDIQTERFHGILNSPLLVGNVLVLSQGVGLDKTTGKQVWKNKDGWALSQGVQDHYASPVFCPAGDSPGVLLFGKYMVLIDPLNGKTLWQQDQVSRIGRIYIDPIVRGDRILYMDCDRANRFKFTAESVTEDNAGLNKRAGAGDMSNPVMWQGYLYATRTSGNDESGMFGISPSVYASVLECFDLRDLKSQWVQHGFTGSPIVCDGKLILQGTWGDVRVVEASPKGFKLLANAKVFEPRGKDPKFPFGVGQYFDASYSAPVLLNGRLYCRFTPGNVFCLDVREDYRDADTAVDARRIAGELITVRGRLGKQPENAASFVAGVLAEDPSAGGNDGVAKTYTLCTKSSTKQQTIAALAEKGAHVSITGVLLYDDRMSVNVVDEDGASDKRK